jgi:hypothetical protein
MASINPLQSNSALSQLLAFQQSAQTGAAQPIQANSAQSTAADSLSISNAALQALQGLGLDPTQAQTYTAKGHHYHHHKSAQAQPGTAAPPADTSQSIQVPQIGQAESALLRAKS